MLLPAKSFLTKNCTFEQLDGFPALWGLSPVYRRHTWKSLNDVAILLLVNKTKRKTIPYLFERTIFSQSTVLFSHISSNGCFCDLTLKYNMCLSNSVYITHSLEKQTIFKAEQITSKALLSMSAPRGDTHYRQSSKYKDEKMQA